MKRLINYFALFVLSFSIITSCCETKYVSKVEVVYRTPPKLVVPKLPRVHTYNKSVFTESEYKKVLSDYSSFVAYVKHLLRLIAAQNKAIDKLREGGNHEDQ